MLQGKNTRRNKKKKAAEAGQDLVPSNKTDAKHAWDATLENDPGVALAPSPQSNNASCPAKLCELDVDLGWLHCWRVRKELNPTCAFVLGRVISEDSLLLGSP